MQPDVLKKTLPFMKYFHEAYPDYHQWIYTNGAFATIENMQMLYQAGIREIRFNLAATNFDKRVIANMKDAKKIFPYVCIEIAMLKESYEGLLKNIKDILATGLDQMNLAEFLVGVKHLQEGEKLKQEGELYSYRGYMTSPISSREYTYKIIKKASEEKWPVIIKDCSNEYKHYKLSIQANKRNKIFTGKKGYWGNNYPVSAVDDWNDGLMQKK